jgi:hypothetical protein
MSASSWLTPASECAPLAWALYLPPRNLLRDLVWVDGDIDRDLGSRLLRRRLRRIEHQICLVDHDQDDDAVRNSDVGLGYQHPKEFQNAGSFKLCLDLLDDESVGRRTQIG